MHLHFPVPASDELAFEKRFMKCNGLNKMLHPRQIYLSFKHKENYNQNRY
jgi:hypothetical protein